MRAAVLVVCGVHLGAAVLSARHSFAAEYDGNLPVTVSGTVAKIDWQNPHIYVYVDARDDEGKVAQWKFEGYPPNMLVDRKWVVEGKRVDGGAITVTSWRTRLDPQQGSAREVT